MVRQLLVGVGGVLTPGQFTVSAAIPCFLPGLSSLAVGPTALHPFLDQD